MGLSIQRLRDVLNSDVDKDGLLPPGTLPRKDLDTMPMLFFKQGEKPMLYKRAFVFTPNLAGGRPTIYIELEECPGEDEDLPKPAG